MSSEIFMNACIKGIGKTTGAVLTMLCSWKLIKYIYGNDDIMSFIIGEKKSFKNNEYHLVNNQVFVEDLVNNEVFDDNEEKFKRLFSSNL